MVMSSKAGVPLLKTNKLISSHNVQQGLANEVQLDSHKMILKYQSVSTIGLFHDHVSLVTLAIVKPYHLIYQL